MSSTNRNRYAILHLYRTALAAPTVERILLDRNIVKQLRPLIVGKWRQSGTENHQKSFKKALKQLCVIPQFSTDYKAASVFEYH